MSDSLLILSLAASTPLTLLPFLKKTHSARTSRGAHDTFGGQSEGSLECNVKQNLLVPLVQVNNLP